MKTLKFILIAAFLIINSLVFAQPVSGGQKGGKQGPPPIPNAEQIQTMVSKLATEIPLSTEQETKILSIYTNHFEIVKDKTSGNKKPRKEEMDALHTVFENSIKAELTDEQFKKYQDFTKKQRQQAPPR